jgi:CO/xanthine dehydrogenase FAD-binding subunit
MEIRRAGEAAVEHSPFVTDKRATEAYRRRLVGVLVRRAVSGTIAVRAHLAHLPAGPGVRK